MSSPVYDVAVLVGSLNRVSINRQLVAAIAGLSEGRLRFREIDLSGLPIYSDDLWENPPAAVLELKAAVEAADAVLFATPEFNRSIPPVLKNAIDWGSRPWGKSSWVGKPAAIIGASPGSVGTAAVQAHLRSILPVLDMALMGQPEVYLMARPGLFAEDGKLTDETTVKFLETWVSRFHGWVARLTADAARRDAA